MSWHFLQGREEASWEGTCLAGAPSALLSLLSTQEKCCLPASETDCCQSSQSGTTCELSTESRGAEGLMSLPEGSPAKTFQLPEVATDLTEKEADSGWKWPGSLAKYDRNLRLWKTRQLSLLGDWEEFSGTWPRWGSMQDGEFFPLRTLEHDTSANASGSWPTPCKTDGMKVCCKTTMERKERGESRPSGAKIGSSLMWFRPSVERWTKDGWLSPTLHELLMIWPPSWTDLRPLAMDRFQQWRQWHGGF